MGLLITKLRKIYCWVCEWKKNFKWWIFGKVASKNVVISCTLCTWPTLCWQMKKVLVTSRFINKPFLFWLVKSPPHLKYAATLPCNLSLMACFADSNVSQGSVATYARCVGVFNMHLTGNLPRNLPVKKFCKWLTFDRIVVLSLWPHFLAHSVVTYKENKIELDLLKID